jgi:FkbM family methyltransferase
MNIAANVALETVTALEVAVSDHVGDSLLDRRASSWGKRRLVAVSSEEATVSVPVTSLDALAAAGTIVPDDVGLLWIDVEGHEGHVLAGACSLLERGVPVVFELHTRRLDRSGTGTRLTELLMQHYTDLVDLRDGSAAQVQAIAALPDVIERRRAGGHTDVLVFRR